MDADLVNLRTSVFDFGCGRGQDVLHLRERGITAVGWDPAYMPHTSHSPADVVNLGYVVNVIEDPTERRQVLESAWMLAQQLLIVSARLYGERDLAQPESCGDGCVTRKGTFQKFFTQSELRDWIQEVLKEAPAAGAPGVYFVFRRDAEKQRFLAARFRCVRRPPVPVEPGRVYERHKEELELLAAFVTARGRLPQGKELPVASELERAFGTVQRAFAVVRQVTDPEQWDRIRSDCQQELLIHLAVDHIRGRRRFSELPRDMQLDIRHFFSSYAHACAEADRLLFSAGNLHQLSKAMEKSSVGKMTRDALYVHADALLQLETCLRIYEGCARSYLGIVEAANIVKLHRLEPMVSYLSYPQFDRDPHPALAGSLSVKLANASVKYQDFTESANPPVLHRKEMFLASDDPRREKYARLTRQEERHGLFANPAMIGTQKGWEEALRSHGVKLRGHQLVRDTNLVLEGG